MGTLMKIVSPLLLGFRPRSLSRMAFSMGFSAPLSHGVITSVRASGEVMLAT